MIRIGLVSTNWGVHRCGVAEYSRMLIENANKIAPDVEFTPIFGPYDFANLYPRVMAGRFDIIHFAYDSGFLGIFAPGVAQTFRRDGAKLVITLCDHHARNNAQIFPFVKDFDRVVVHHKTENEPWATFIPIGIDVMENSPWTSANTTIGIAGFPLAQKRTLEVAQAATILIRETPRITGCTMVCPESQHIDTHEIKRQVLRACPQTNYITDWLPQQRVQEVMASNLVNVYPMSDGKSGISSSVRMAIAGGSPMVLSRSWMFADWRDDEVYAQEIEWIEGDPAEITPRKIADAVLRVIENGKRPRRILEDMPWNKTAGQYVDLYRSLIGQGVAA